MQIAYFAGGCFWCVEAIFQRIDGVKELTNGYCNGSTQNPTYEEVCSGQSGHAEVLKIEFDEQQISFRYKNLSSLSIRYFCDGLQLLRFLEH